MALGNEWLEQKFYLKVKQLGQFMDRFNYQEKLTTPAGDTASRWINLISLLNHEDTALIANPDTKTFLKQCYTDSATAKLNYHDSLWYAAVKTQFEYKGKTVEIELLLVPEHYQNGGVAWVVQSANSKILDIDTVRNTNVFINPMGHEVGFLDIAKVFVYKQQFSSMFRTDYEYSKLSVLDYLIQKQELKFIQINNIEYTIHQISGWEFTVKEFNRNSLNSGWLISKISKK